MSIPIDRVLYKLDALMSRRDYDAAERHLGYWLSEAQSFGDSFAALTVTNELIGFYRKTGRENEALSTAERALSLADELFPHMSIQKATSYLNAATAYNAFGYPDAALPLFETAREGYEALLSDKDARLAGLYNNMASALFSSGDVIKAKEYYHAALGILDKLPGSETDAAVTYCNLADTDPEGSAEYLCRALELLNSDSVCWDGSYAFVCSRCASAFKSHGLSDTALELERRAEEIYERA